MVGVLKIWFGDIFCMRDGFLRIKGQLGPWESRCASHQSEGETQTLPWPPAKGQVFKSSPDGHLHARRRVDIPCLTVNYMVVLTTRACLPSILLFLLCVHLSESWLGTPAYRFPHPPSSVRQWTPLNTSCRDGMAVLSATSSSSRTKKAFTNILHAAPKCPI